MRLTIRVPADNCRGPLYTEQALAAIGNRLGRRQRLCFEMTTAEGGGELACHAPKRLAGHLRSQLVAHYPDSRIESDTGQATLPSGWKRYAQQLTLWPDLFPIKRYAQFEDSLNRTAADPLAGLLAAMQPSGDDRLPCRIRLSLRPAPAARRWQADCCLNRLTHPWLASHPRLARLYLRLAMSRWLLLHLLAEAVALALRAGEESSYRDPLHTAPHAGHHREVDLQAASHKRGGLLFEARLTLSVAAPAEAKPEARRRLDELAAAFGQFTAPRLAAFRPVGRFRALFCRPFLFSAEEVVTLWHPPTGQGRAAGLEPVTSRHLPPPPGLPKAADHPEAITLGTAGETRQPVLLLPEDRRRHLAVLGKTGMGKSTLLANLLAADIAADRGVGLIDPHGDLAERALRFVPKARTNDVVLFDPTDRSYPIAFNPLACPRPEDRALRASGIVAVFKKLYGDSWGPRLEHILRNAVLALLEVPGASLISLLRFLNEARYRQTIVGRLADPVVRSFWQQEFAQWNPQLQREAVASVQNKVGQFLANPVLRAILGQSRSRLDFRRIIDEGRILIAKLSKGRIGEDASGLLGALLIGELQLAAMSRAELPEAARRDFFLTVDEFQHFATESFAEILSEARKYRLNLTLANQYLAQMEHRTAEALFGNVGTLVAFQVGARDSQPLAEQFGGDLRPDDLLALPHYRAYLRLLIDGVPSRPFSLTGLPPPRIEQEPGRPTIIRRTSRHRYARPATEVDREIATLFEDG